MHATSVSPRPHVATIETCLHGSLDDAELMTLGLRREDVLDFSASTNPLGPSPAAMEAIKALTPDEIGRYPEDGAPTLREALAAHLGVPSPHILVANGSTEILWLLAFAYLAPGDNLLVVGPTFGEYARAGRAAGADVVEYRAQREEGFIPNPSQIVALAHGNSVRMVCLCNPNNPTGVVVDREALLTLVDRLSGSLIMIDESYAAFAGGMRDVPDALGSNVVLLRSLTKDGGLAGLRAGYAVASQDVIENMNRVRPPWNVNVAAQHAAMATLADGAHLARARAEVQRARTYLLPALASLGLRPVNGRANFLLVHVGDGAALRAALLRRGVCVRDCASFGLPEYIRIGIRTQHECEVLVGALLAEMNRA